MWHAKSLTGTRQSMAWFAAVLLTAATHVQAEPFDGMPRSEPALAGPEMPSILATPAEESADGFGWSSGAAAGGAFDGAHEPAPAEGFLITDGCVGGFSSGADGGVDCDEGCPQPGMCDKPGLCNRIFGHACPRWVVQVDALMLWQGNIASRPLFAAVDPTTAAVGPTPAGEATEASFFGAHASSSVSRVRQRRITSTPDRRRHRAGYSAR